MSELARAQLGLEGPPSLRQLALGWLEFTKAHPFTGYWIPGLLALGVALLSALLPATQNPGDRSPLPRFVSRPAVFDVAAGLALLVFSVPTMALAELNPDESGMIVEAMSLFDSPHPWITIEGSTHTPFASIPLLLPVLLGLPIEYGGARLARVACTWLCDVLLHRTLRRPYGETPARLGTFPPLLFAAFLGHPELISYDAEIPTAVVLSLSLYLLVRLAGQKPVTALSAWGLGAVLGLTPFAKSQGFVPAFGLAVLGMWVIVRGAMISPTRRPWRELLAYLAGGLSPGLAAVLYMLSQGQLGYFWQSFVVSIFDYLLAKGNGPFFPAAKSYLLATFHYREFALLGWTTLILGTLGAVGWAFPRVWRARGTQGVRRSTRSRHPPPPSRPDLEQNGSSQTALIPAAALIFLVTSVLAVVGPRVLALHYAWLLWLPLGFAGAVGGAVFLRGARMLGRFRPALVLVLLVAVLFPLLHHRFYVSGYVQNLNPAPVATDPVSARLLRYAPPGTRIAVWGWVDRYYVYAGMLPAARESATARLMLPWFNHRDYFRQVYLADLQRSDPLLFVDAVAPHSIAFFDRAREGIESFPALRAWMADRYQTVDEIDGVRIFLRMGESGRK